MSGAENLILSSKNVEKVVNIEKSIKGSRIIFDNGHFLYTSGIRDIKIEGDIITIYRTIQHSRFSVDFNSPTLEKHGTASPSELVRYWQANNFFFDIATPLVSSEQVVNTFSELPIPSSFPGQIFFVKKQSGIWITGTRKQSGFYVSNGTKWEHSNDPLQYFIDDQLTFKDGNDFTKTLQFQLDNISSSTNRVATWQDKSGIIAMISDSFAAGKNEYIDQVKIATPVITTSQVPVNVLSKNYNSPSGGKYKVMMLVKWRQSNQGQSAVFEFLVNGIIFTSNVKEPKDSSDSPIIQVAQDVTLLTGANTISVQMYKQNGGAIMIALQCTISGFKVPN